MPSLKVTQQDIAEALNISRATVNKALNGKPLPAVVKDEILKKARELGYWRAPEKNDSQSQRLNIAQAPAGHAGMLMLICFPPDPAGPRPAAEAAIRWQRLVMGMEKTCEANGYSLIVMVLSESSESVNELLEQHTMNKISGAILTGDCDRVCAFFRSFSGKLPIVVADVDNPQRHRFDDRDTLVYDTNTAIGSIVRHFAEAGHTRIAYVGYSDDPHACDERHASLVNSCAECGIGANSPIVAISDFSEGWREGLEKRLAVTGAMPTAFVCEDDAIALGVKSALTRAGFRVPGDFCISGFDSLDGTSLEQGIMTTLFHREELGALAVEQLVRRIRNPEQPCLTVRQQVKVAFQCPLMNQRSCSRRV